MIRIEADTGEEWDSRIGWADLAQAAAGSALRHSEYAGLADAGKLVEISVKFTSDAEVRSLNAAYRNKDRATNVLSFPMMEADHIQSIASAAPAEILLGDIVLAHGVCEAEAREKGVAMETHASHLVVHGTLHLLGYDHEEGEDRADAMEQIEREALAAIGIADPYAMTPVQA